MLGKVMGFIPTKKPDLAKKFYSQTLGLKFIADEFYALVFSSKDIMICVQKLREDQTHTPAENTLLGWPPHPAQDPRALSLSLQPTEVPT